MTTQGQGVTLSDITDLTAMLSYMRPGGSRAEEDFRKRFLTHPDMQKDAAGNIFMWVPNHDGTMPTTLWSSHTDTVHREPGFQGIAFDPKNKLLFVAKKSRDKASCLGADCTVGVWIMLRMIAANVPGLYVFHALEERGGIGSLHFAENSLAILKGITHAIAFDRRGTGSVITEQMCGITASDAFAQDLALRLEAANPNLLYAPDNGGTFTDTANYADIVPECTNISVGFYGEHTAGETLDVQHAHDLMRAMTTGDFNNLVVSRDPNCPSNQTGGRWTSWTNYDATSRKRESEVAFGVESLEDLEKEFLGEGLEAVLEMMPKECADVLHGMGITKLSLLKMIADNYDLPTNRRWDYSS